MFAYLVNFLLILLAITVFIAPFYLVYYYRHRPPVQSYAEFNHSLERFFSSQQANYLVLCWSAAEAVVWFVIPEFLLVLVIFMRVHKKRQMLMYDIYGTAIGTIVALALSLKPATLVKLPYIQPQMVSLVQGWFSKDGLFALLHQPFSGVPYKIFTNTVSHYHVSIYSFLVLAVIVRVARYVVIYGITLAAFPVLHKYVYKNYLYLYVATIFIFSVLLYKVYLEYGH